MRVFPNLMCNDFFKVLCDFPNLQILYLHGNLIADINEVDKLRTVKSVKKLALHGNPIENIKVRLSTTANCNLWL